MGKTNIHITVEPPSWQRLGLKLWGEDVFYRLRRDTVRHEHVLGEDELAPSVTFPDGCEILFAKLSEAYIPIEPR